MLKGIVLGLVLTCLDGITGWVNDYDHPFTFTCPTHQSISRVVSHHDNGPEDRKFDFECIKYTDASESCFWSNNVNDLDQPFAFQCPHGGVLDGVASAHDNHAEDRRFKFYCCQKPGMCLYNCYYSGFVNGYDKDVDYRVPAGYVMRGWVSVHDNGPEDRIFDFEVCKIQLCEEIDGGTIVGRRNLRSNNTSINN